MPTPQCLSIIHILGIAVAWALLSNNITIFISTIIIISTVIILLLLIILGMAVAWTGLSRRRIKGSLVCERGGVARHCGPPVTLIIIIIIIVIIIIIIVNIITIITRL